MSSVRPSLCELEAGSGIWYSSWTGFHRPTASTSLGFGVGVLVCLFENSAPNINKWQVDHDDDEAASVCTLHFFSSYSYHRGWPGQRDRARDKDRWLYRGCPCRMERRLSHSEGITPEHSIVINCSYLMALIRGYFPWGLSYNWNECNQIIRPRTIQFDLIRRFVAAEKFTLTWWRHRANICARCLGFSHNNYTVRIHQ